MSFDLKISFTGMCLYVPDPARKRMHVLMPRSGNGHSQGNGHAHGNGNGHAHGGHAAGAAYGGGRDAGAEAAHEGGVEAHVARVFADAAYLFAGGGGKSGHVVGLAKLDDRLLELTGLAASPIDLDLSGRQLGDVGRVVESTVPRKRLDGPDEKVFCRVTLDAGSATGNAAGAVWEVDGTEQPLTYRIDWTIPDVRSEGALRLRTATPDGVPAQPLPDLHPIPDLVTGRPTVELHVFHVPDTELPPWPRPNTEPPSGHHFVGLYDLFDNPAKRPVPRFLRMPAGVPGPIGVDPARCMGGTGGGG